MTLQTQRSIQERGVSAFTLPFIFLPYLLSLYTMSDHQDTILVEETASPAPTTSHSNSLAAIRNEVAELKANIQQIMQMISKSQPSSLTVEATVASESDLEMLENAPV